MSLVNGIEAVIGTTLRQDPRAVIDAEILSNQLSWSKTDHIVVVLQELADSGLLKLVFLWQCANGRGTALETDRLDTLPSAVVCDRCGQNHEMDTHSIEVQFVATVGLLRALGLSAG